MKVKAALVLGTLWAGPALAQAPRDEPAWRSIEVWRQPQGLPQNTVFAILQTRDGYLWVGTKGGVSRFDGVRFKTFDDRTKQELKDSEVQALTEGDDGSLWVATYGGGLTRIKDGRFTTYTTREGLPSDFVWALCKDAEGAIWAGTALGVSRLKDDRFTTFTTREGLHQNSVVSLHADRDGPVWLGTSGGGLHRYEGGRLNNGIPGVSPLGTSVLSITRDTEQGLWIGTADGLFRLKDGGIVRFTAGDGLVTNRIRRLHVDRQGNLWIGTNSGLNRYRDGAFLSYAVAEDPSRVNVSAIYGDREGNLWVGYTDQGLARVREGQFVTYLKGDGLPHEQILSVFEDRTGALWVGTSDGLVVRRAGTFVRYAEDQGLPAKGPISIAQDLEGRLWLSTEAGIFRSRSSVDCTVPQCVPRFEAIDTSLGGTARAITVDRSGTVWIGADTLLRYEDGRLIRYSAQDGFPEEAIKTIVADPDGGLWIATKTGLTRLKDGRFTVYGEKDGLASNALEGLYIDPEKTLWVATRQGLSRFKQGRFATYTANEGLYTNFIHSVIGDDRGNLWITCAKGIFRVRKQDLDDFADGKTRAISSVGYGVEHGLMSSVATAGYTPGVYKTRDGRVWFATYRGLSVVDPARLDVNTVPPPVHIEEVTVDGRAFDPAGPAEAPPGRGDIAIRYTALTFLAAHKVTFKYKLEGYDRDWVDAGQRREAYYSNIPPGPYTFHVIAANSDGVWNETGASLPLALRPHFHQTRTFHAALALGVALAALALHRRRTAVLHRRERELAAAVDDRTRELRQVQTELEQRVRARTADLQGLLSEKEVLLKEVHHRVKNNLQIVSSLLSLQTGHTTDSKALEALKESQDRVWAIGQVHEKLYRSGQLARIDAGEYIQGLVSHLQSSYGPGDGIELRVEVEPVELGLDTAVSSGLIVNELVSNAFKHAFPNGRSGKIRIELRPIPPDRLLLRVADDGVGLPEGIDERERRGLGLELVKALTEQLGGSLEVLRGLGTTFEVRFAEVKSRESTRGA